VLIDLLQQVADGQLSRLIVTCPPRLGKSLLVSKLFPAYFLQRYPHLFAAIASYSAELAYAHSREARHFYRVTGHLLARDSAAVGNWLTRQRGGCIAAGVDGPFTGKGYSLGIIDDPYKGPGDAASPALRQKLIDWLRSVWLTRAEPASVLGPDGSEQPNLSAQVVVLTRWDHQDVIGWLYEQELGEAPQHWTVLDLPAIAEEPAERPQAAAHLHPDPRLAPGGRSPVPGAVPPAGTAQDPRPAGGLLVGGAVPAAAQPGVWIDLPEAVDPAALPPRGRQPAAASVRTAGALL
jgi:hypothetical protein